MSISVEVNNVPFSSILSQYIQRALTYYGVEFSTWNSSKDAPFDLVEKQKPTLIFSAGDWLSHKFKNHCKANNIKIFNYDLNVAMSDPLIYFKQNLEKTFNTGNFSEPIVHSDESLKIVNNFQSLSFKNSFRAFSINVRNNISGFRYYGPISEQHAAHLANSAEFVLCTTWWQFHNFSLCNDKCIFKQDLGNENTIQKSLNNSNLLYVNKCLDGAFDSKFKDFISERV